MPYPAGFLFSFPRWSTRLQHLPACLPVTPTTRAKPKQPSSSTDPPARPFPIACQIAMAQQQQVVRRVLKVAPPGKGDGECFPTVQAAVDAVPLGNRARVVIRLAPGVYREPVYVAKTKNFITIAGASPEATVVSWDNTATRIKHSQVRGGVCSLTLSACLRPARRNARQACVHVLRSVAVISRFIPRTAVA